MEASAYQYSPTLSCRICLDDEETDSLFRPCHCKSYVHHRCLNEWRVTRQNPQAENNCEVCQFKYHYSRNVQYASKWYMKTIKFMIINKCFLLFINFVLITFLALLLDVIDTRDKLADALDERIKSDIAVYYLFSAFILTMILLILYLIQLFTTIKNKKLYFQYYSQNGMNCARIVIGMILSIVLLALWPLLGILLYSLTTQYFLVKHYSAVIKLDEIQQDVVLDISEIEELGN